MISFGLTTLLHSHRVWNVILFSHQCSLYAHGNPQIHEGPALCALFPSYKLQPFIFHITNLGLGHQHPAVQRKRGDVSGDLPRVLLRFEGQNDLIVCVRDKFEGGEAVSWVERTDALHRYGAEICGAGQHEVGGAPLVCCLVVTLVAGAAREEEPALEPLAPCR